MAKHYRVSIRRQWSDVGVDLIYEAEIEAEGPYAATRKALLSYEPEPQRGTDAPLLIHVVSVL